MAAGFCAGITEALIIVTPFEVVKIRLQQQRGLAKELLKYRVCTSEMKEHQSSIAASQNQLNWKQNGQMEGSSHAWCGYTDSARTRAARPLASI